MQAIPYEVQVVQMQGFSCLRPLTLVSAALCAQSWEHWLAKATSTQSLTCCSSCPEGIWVLKDTKRLHMVWWDRLWASVVSIIIHESGSVLWAPVTQLLIIYFRIRSRRWNSSVCPPSADGRLFQVVSKSNVLQESMWGNIQPTVFLAVQGFSSRYVIYSINKSNEFIFCNSTNSRLVLYWQVSWMKTVLTDCSAHRKNVFLCRVT